MFARAPYEGSRRKLVIAIDIGTTYSGVSYCILDPGCVPITYGVNRYPGQERVGADAKVPSIIYYDSKGFVGAVGAEAAMDDAIQRAMELQWSKAEWFKLHLRPVHTATPSDEPLPPLPPHKTVQRVFVDFLEYLHRCTREYIEQTHVGGPQIWEDLEGEAVYILTHPNSWGGAQQAKMRQAAIDAGLVPDTAAGRARIKFVTEGEASLHYCVSSNLASEITKSKNGVIIVDAGGGTIDLSAFALGDADDEIKEIAPASCLFHGSIYVTRRAKKFLTSKLYKSIYGHAEEVQHMAECFDKSAKLSFKDPGQISLIKFGSTRDSDDSVDIRVGQLKLQGSDVATFFEPSITAIKEAIQAQKAAAHVPVKSILLVGGFAANSWLFTELQGYSREQGLQLYRPDGHLGKAVADGAISYLVDHFVSMRVIKMTIVTPVITEFIPHNPEHQRRRRIGHVKTGLDGKKYVRHSCGVIVTKGNAISESSVFRQSFSISSRDKWQLTTIESDIMSYRGSKSRPEWLDVEPEMYDTMCTVTANTALAALKLPRLFRADGQGYYELCFAIELLFGLTEYEARICWTENGKERRGPATIAFH